MKKVFIFSICSTCNEPVGMIDPCNELGYNAFPTTNFHGEKSIEETEQIRLDLIDLLKKEGKFDQAESIERYSKVMEITFTI